MGDILQTLNLVVADLVSHCAHLLENYVLNLVWEIPRSLHIMSAKRSQEDQMASS